jgi:hypothetical protein
MAKEVPAFLRAEIGNTPTNPTQEPQNRVLGRLAQMRLQFAEGQLDEVEVRRILRLQLTFAAREEPPHRPPAACDPAFAHRREDLVQHQVRLVGNQFQQTPRAASGGVLPPLARYKPLHRAKIKIAKSDKCHSNRVDGLLLIEQ